jgi:hypothetical protein
MQDESPGKPIPGKSRPISIPKIRLATCQNQPSTGTIQLREIQKESGKSSSGFVPRDRGSYWAWSPGFFVYTLFLNTETHRGSRHNQIQLTAKTRRREARREEENPNSNSSRLPSRLH